jgi:hypothetical protein
VILGGIFAGLAGAWLTLEFNASFQNGMTANRGFIALAAVIFGRWTPIGAFGGALLFVFFEALASRSGPTCRAGKSGPPDTRPALARQPTSATHTVDRETRGSPTKTIIHGRLAHSRRIPTQGRIHEHLSDTSAEWRRDSRAGARFTHQVDITSTTCGGHLR